MNKPQRPVPRALPLGDGVHVQAHRGHLAAAVLVELVATGLASEAVEEELVAEVTVGQLEEGLADLESVGRTSESTKAFRTALRRRHEERLSRRTHAL